MRLKHFYEVWTWILYAQRELKFHCGTQLLWRRVGARAFINLNYCIKCLSAISKLTCTTQKRWIHLEFFFLIFTLCAFFYCPKSLISIVSSHIHTQTLFRITMRATKVIYKHAAAINLYKTPHVDNSLILAIHMHEDFIYSLFFQLISYVNS
jgi:hypothetical protein